MVNLNNYSFIMPLICKLYTKALVKFQVNDPSKILPQFIKINSLNRQDNEKFPQNQLRFQFGASLNRFQIKNTT